jgi:16S rRNA (cytosine1402-N4)-methyltransferase
MPHTPVLLHEVIEYLNLAPEKQVIDATLDGGGHSREIVQRFPGIKLIGIEFDPDEFAQLRESDPELLRKITAVNDSYINIEQIAAANEIKPHAVLFDLGVSSWHYEASGRGFSFQHDEPLDMRFNPQVQKVTAVDIVNKTDEQELAKILSDLGEEQFAETIAQKIAKVRREKPIVGTMDLLAVIHQAVPEWYKHRKIHWATKTFQALRMVVNDELENIRKGLKGAANVLQSGGRLVVISFHGLEDKAVRQVFKEEVAAGRLKWVTKDTIKPAWGEIKRNPRSRSAKMKIAEKI